MYEMLVVLIFYVLVSFLGMAALWTVAVKKRVIARPSFFFWLRADVLSSPNKPRVAEVIELEKYLQGCTATFITGSSTNSLALANTIRMIGPSLSRANLRATWSHTSLASELIQQANQHQRKSSPQFANVVPQGR